MGCVIKVLKTKGHSAIHVLAILYEIDSFYEHRPDLLSYDLYGTPKLWWCFQHRNMDTLTDPIWSFVAGTLIRIPKKSTLEQYLDI